MAAAPPKRHPPLTAKRLNGKLWAQNETSEANEAAGKRAASYVEAARFGDCIRRPLLEPVQIQPGE